MPGVEDLAHALGLAAQTVALALIADQTADRAAQRFVRKVFGQLPAAEWQDLRDSVAALASEA